MTATDRLEACRWAAGMLRRADVVYLDTETTGLDGDAEIVDLAVIDGAGRVLLDTLVRPRRPIPREASEVHGITTAMVVRAPEWPVVYARLWQVLRQHPTVIVYNADFDRRILDQVCRSHRLPSLEADWHCAMLRYAAYVGEPNPKYGGYRWHRLEAAARAVGVAMPTAHRALVDVQACRAVVHAMAHAV